MLSGNETNTLKQSENESSVAPVAASTQTNDDITLEHFQSVQNFQKLNLKQKSQALMWAGGALSVAAGIVSKIMGNSFASAEKHTGMVFLYSTAAVLFMNGKEMAPDKIQQFKAWLKKQVDEFENNAANVDADKFIKDLTKQLLWRGGIAALGTAVASKIIIGSDLATTQRRAGRLLMLSSAAAGAINIAPKEQVTQAKEWAQEKIRTSGLRNRL